MARHPHSLFHEYQPEIDEKLCFVLMPFAAEFQPIYDDHIKPTVERAGLRCMRADDLFGPQAIIYDIWKYICKARVVIAELTGRNPNVFYEVGLGHALDKKVILLTQSMDDVPFDLRHLRCIVYRYDPRGAAALEENLSRAIEAVLQEPVVAVKVGEDVEELRRESERYQKEAGELRRLLRGMEGRLEEASGLESRLRELETLLSQERREKEELLERPVPTIHPLKALRLSDPPKAIIDPRDGREMIYIPAGEFAMGSSFIDPHADDNEKPQHRVHVEAFYIDKYPVDQRGLQEIRGSDGTRPA